LFDALVIPHGPNNRLCALLPIDIAFDDLMAPTISNTNSVFWQQDCSLLHFPE